MNWTDKEIDELFKDSAGNSSFEYKEEYWSEMEAMLPPQGGKGILWLMTSLVFIGLIGATSFVNGSDLNSDTTLIASNQISSPTRVEFDAKTKNGYTDNTKETPGYLNAVNNSDIFTQQKTSIQTNNLEGEGLKTAESISTNRSNANAIDAFSDPLVSESKVAEQQGSLVNPPTEVSTEESIINENTLVSSDQSLKEVSSTNVQVLSTKSAEVIDFLEEQVLVSSLQNVRNSLRPSLYIQGLGGLSQSLISPSEKLSYSAGVGFGVRVNKGRLVMNAGINGIWSVHDDLILSREAKVYGFGSEVYRYELKYKEMFSLEADLSLGYQVRKSTFRLGVRPSILVGTKVNYQLNTGAEESTTENFYGFSDGLYRLGFKPTIGYSYDFRNGVTLGVNIGVQILESVDELFIDGVNSRLPIDGQIYLRKSINFGK